MMKTTSSLFYYDNRSSYSAVLIPYQYNDFVAIFILPYKGVDINKFVAAFTMDIINDFLSKGEKKNIDCQIPTFSNSYAVGLNEQLQKLGIQQLFGETDLSNMLNLEKQNLGVQITHDSDITVNERGTSADTLNVKPVKKDSPSKDIITFIAERPFFMLIRSVNSHAIVFATLFSI